MISHLSQPRHIPISSPNQIRITRPGTVRGAICVAVSGPVAAVGRAAVLSSVHKGVAVVGIAAAVIYIFRDSKVLDSGTCGENLTWEINAGGTLKVDGSGIMDDYGNYSDTPWFADRDKIKIVEIGENVSSIGSRAFYDCKSLAKTDLGSGVKSIGSYAFYGCSNLENCVLPDSVTSLGSYSFAHCNALEYLHVPASVTHFGVSVVDSARAYICRRLR